MLAALTTTAFAAFAVLALAVVSVSLAKGFSAAASLRRQLALCSDERVVTVRHVSTLPHPFAQRGFSPARASRRKLRNAARQASAQRRLVAA